MLTDISHMVGLPNPILLNRRPKDKRPQPFPTISTVKAINWTRLSCHSFRNNAVRLQLHALAYNLGNFLRAPNLPEAVEHWSLTTLREKLIKIGAKVVRHGLYITFQMTEVAIPKELFAVIASSIAYLGPSV